jgi:isopentenyl diphosphate isomerase/L-lactate dehydrogenase-like FMN-dependent dehydrogenase
VFDYIDGAADDEVTAAQNVAAFRRITFRPRAAVGAVEADTATSVLGVSLSLPVMLAPAGLVRIMHPDGARCVARAAAAAGTVSVLSSVAGTALEEVAAGVDGPLWFQLYAPGGASQTDALVKRAQQAGYAGLVITVDTAALGNRERDVRHGVAPPFRFAPWPAARLGAQVVTRPRWLLGTARSELRGRRRGRDARVSTGAPLSDPAAGDPTARRVAMAASPFTWADVSDIRRRWSGPLVVKGIVTPADATLALGAGADAVVVSNHGGRQLDGAPATMDVLPAVVDAVDGRAPVLVDGGVRRGSDVVKAVAAGACAVLIGRAYLYGLAAAGEAGVGRVLEVLRDDTVRTLQLLGCPSVAQLDRSWIDLPGRDRD